jgi:hypothetical protein
MCMGVIREKDAPWGYDFKRGMTEIIFDTVQFF